jgi:hypothetical protein
MADTLILDRRARKYVRWSARVSDPDITVRLDLGRGAGWHPVEVIPTGPVGADGLIPVNFRVLIAGPSATANPAETVVGGLGANVCTLDIPDTPEQDVADYGVIVFR